MYFSFQYFGRIFYKTITPLVLVGYEMNMANSALLYNGQEWPSEEKIQIQKYITSS